MTAVPFLASSLFFFACGDDPSPCGEGARYDTGDATYCVYGSADIVVEGGFQCPATLPAFRDIGGVRVCSEGDENVHEIPDAACVDFSLPCGSNLIRCTSGGTCAAGSECVGDFCRPAAQLTDAVTFSTGSFRPVGLSDLNGDGRVDFVGFDRDFTTPSNGDLRAFLGNGAGGFVGGAVVDAEGSESFAMGVINSDGAVNMVGARCGAEEPGVVRWSVQGDGSFESEPDLPFSSCGRSLGFLDVDGDGALDLLSANNTVSIYRGLGGGSFADTPLDIDPPGRTVMDIEVADLNADGRPDLAILSERLGVAGEPRNENGRLGVFLGQQDGGFALSDVLVVGELANAMVISDVNEDGNFDFLVTADGGLEPEAVKPGSLVVALGRGDGTFQTASVVANTDTTPRIEREFVLVDINWDGHDDVVMGTVDDVVAGIEELSVNLTVLLGTGTGVFTPTDPIDMGVPVAGVLLADVDGDGVEDLVSGNQESIVTVLRRR